MHIFISNTFQLFINNLLKNVLKTTKKMQTKWKQKKFKNATHKKKRKGKGLKENEQELTQLRTHTHAHNQHTQNNKKQEKCINEICNDYLI